MSEEGKDDGGETQIPEVEEIQPDKDGKYPETVPWKQYVGTKESLGKKLEAERDKVKDLEEKLKNAPNADEHSKIRQELEEVQGKLKVITDERDEAAKKSASEMREALKETKAFTDEELEKMTEAELKVALKATGSKPKSKPDLSGGGGGGGIREGISPMQRAREAYEQSSKK